MFEGKVGLCGCAKVTLHATHIIFFTLTAAIHVFKGKIGLLVVMFAKYLMVCVGL